VATPHITTGPANSLTWKTLEHVKGDGGTLTGLGVAGGTDYHAMRVSIDGKTLANQFLAGTGGSNHVNNGIGVSLPFASDMKVEIKDAPVVSPITTFWVAYVTDNSEPIGESTRIETEDGMEYRYRTVLYAKDSGETYEIETLLGPRFFARIELDWDVVVLAREPGGRWAPFGPGGEPGPPPPEWGPVQLAARTSVLDTHTGEEVGFDSLGAAIRVPGRVTIVGEAAVLAGMTAIQLWLPPGDYSIATTHPEYANVPAYFTVR
jgi:hypothetical protein